MIPSQFVKTRWAGTTKKHYISLGYIFTKILDDIIVDVNHLPPSSTVKIIAICDICLKQRSISFNRYTDKCRSCTGKINIAKYNNDNVEFLSRRMSAMNKAMSGEKHPKWNKDKSYKDRAYHRFKPEYVEWARMIKVLSNFRCVICGESKSGKMVSHHLASYLSNPELRFEVDNGVCLCNECHYDFHRKYGNKNNSPEQFSEYKLLKHFESFIC